MYGNCERRVARLSFTRFVTASVLPILCLLALPPHHLSIYLPTGLLHISRNVSAAVSAMPLQGVTDNYHCQEGTVLMPRELQRALCTCDAMERPKRVSSTAFPLCQAPAMYLHTLNHLPTRRARQWQQQQQQLKSLKKRQRKLRFNNVALWRDQVVTSPIATFCEVLFQWIIKACQRHVHRWNKCRKLKWTFLCLHQDSFNMHTTAGLFNMKWRPGWTHCVKKTNKLGHLAVGQHTCTNNSHFRKLTRDMHTQ